MGKKNNFIELNGKQYDALTGELLHSAATSVKPHAKPAIDGFTRPHAAATHHPQSQKTPPKHAPQHKVPAASSRTMDIVASRPQHHVKAHPAEHSKTLMRHVVKKPAASLKRHVKAQTPTDILAKAPSVAVLPKFSFHTVDPDRLQRAKRIAKSRLIRRFAPMQSITYLGSSSSAAAPFVPPMSKPVRPTAAPQPTATGASMDIFQKALVRATSHEQPAVHTTKRAAKAAKRAHSTRKSRIGRRVLNTTATALAILLVAGFIGYQNKANITMRVASAHAGFHANLPGYKPSGFAIGKFSYGTGVVAVNFHSNSDNRAFTVTQKVSNWDSETLLDNYVATTADNYQALQSGGRTIYMYGNNNATWVDNGVWYQVTDDGSLSTNQVLQLAQSM